jgi:hypothetical protein
MTNTSPAQGQGRDWHWDEMVSSGLGLSAERWAGEMGDKGVTPEESN